MNLDGLPLFAPPKSESGPVILTVSEITRQVKSTLENGFKTVWVKGEISNFRPASSGHLYFSLKDSTALLSAVYFGWGSKKQKFVAKEGVEVLCRGRITVYPQRGNDQLVIDQMESFGAGALQLAYEELKERLEKEGLFKPVLKRALPFYPERIAVVTSPSGAVIRDILNVMGRRAPNVRITLIPTVVQGVGASEQIRLALKRAIELNLGDVVVLARGGGSFEDLNCFNDEALARDIRACPVPVLSAVGHETDFTIADFVADLRAPTPSAAAEILSQHWFRSSAQIVDWRSRLFSGMVRYTSRKWETLKHIAARMVSPRDKLRIQMQRCDDFSFRLSQAISRVLERKQALLSQTASSLDALSPLRVLDRGFALVHETDQPENWVVSAAGVQTGIKLTIVLKDGKLPVKTI